MSRVFFIFFVGNIAKSLRKKEVSDITTYNNGLR